MRLNVFYDPDNDYYEIIGIAPNADRSTIQRAYRAKAKQLHPDVNQDRHEWAKEQFQLLNEAYSVLNDSEKRRVYDNLRWPYQFHTAEANPRYRERQPTGERPKPRPSWQYEERPYQQYYRPPHSQTYTQATPPQQSPRAAWLDQVGLGWFKSTYIAIADVMESPYRYILIFVGLLLAVNVVLIAAGVWQSKDGSNNSNVVIVATNTLNAGPPISNPDVNANLIPTQTPVPSVTPVVQIVPTFTPQPTPTLTFTPQPREMVCHPDIEIFAPPNGQTIFRHSLPEDVQVVGRIAVPDMFTYSVEARLFDPITTLPSEPIMLREVSSEPETPVENGIIVTLDELRYGLSGTYEVLILVWDNQQMLLGQCSIIVVKGE